MPEGVCAERYVLSSHPHIHTSVGNHIVLLCSLKLYSEPILFYLFLGSACIADVTTLAIPHGTLSRWEVVQGNSPYTISSDNELQQTATNAQNTSPATGADHAHTPAHATHTHTKARVRSDRIHSQAHIHAKLPHVHLYTHEQRTQSVISYLVCLLP